MITSIGQGASIAITINAVDKFSKTFKAASFGIRTLEVSMKAAAIAIVATGAALTTIGIASLKVASDFETAFTGVRKTVELTEKGFKELENRFKEISKTTPIAFTELAHIGELAGQLGVVGVDNIEKFTKTIADISVTTNLSAEQAATDFARFANIMNMPIDNVDRLGSVVVDLGNNLATTEAEIVNMGMRISGAGKALNMTEGQVMAWGAALSSVGVRAEMGGTAISKLMINISSMVATGSEELIGFAEVAGMTVDEFSQAFRDDASKALQTFFNGLGQIKDKGGNVLTTLENLDIKEVRLRDAVLRLSSSYGTLNESLGLQDAAWQANTALIEEAEKRYDTFDSRVKVLKNTFGIFMASIGDEFMPVMKDLVEVLTKKVMPALEPLVPLLGEFFKKAIEAITPHLEGMTTKFVELADVFFNKVIPNVIDLAQKVGGFLRDKFILIWDIIKKVIPVFMTYAEVVFDAAKQLWEELSPALDELIPIVITFLESLKPLIPKIVELAKEVFYSAVQIAKELFPALSSLIPIIMDVIDVIIDLLPTVTDIITTLLRLAKNIISGAAPAITVLKDVFLAIINPIKTVIGWITDLLDLIGKFLGQSSKLNKESNKVSKRGDILTHEKSSNYKISEPIHLNPDFVPTIKLNDFILSNGRIIEPNPQDTIIGAKTPNALGITIIIEGDVNGTDPEQMAEAFGRELKQAIRI